MIDDLNEKVRAHQAGTGTDRVAIREGIYEASLKKDLERSG